MADEYRWLEALSDRAAPRRVAAHFEKLLDGRVLGPFDRDGGPELISVADTDVAGEPIAGDDLAVRAQEAAASDVSLATVEILRAQEFELAPNRV